jgi:alkylhydroperoxidase family enzyme
MPESRRSAGAGWLAPAEDTAEIRRLYADDLAQNGFVMNLSRVWAHRPGLHDRLFALLQEAFDAAGLTDRQKGVLIAACAAAREDSYCSLAWGTRLAGAAGGEVAAAVLRGEHDALGEGDRVLARWAHRVASDPNGTGPHDVQELRDAGFDDARILAITVYVAGRLAFSSVNGALGAAPDAEYRALAPAPVRSAVDYGRPVSS